MKLKSFIQILIFRQTRKNGYEQRCNAIQVVELQYNDGMISCDRNQPAHLYLKPPR